MKRADVDAGFAKDRADATNYPGHVAVVHYQHEPARNRFDAEVVDFNNAADALTADDAKDCSGNGLFAFSAVDDRANRRSRCTATNVGSRYLYSPLVSDQKGINQIHA